MGRFTDPIVNLLRAMGVMFSNPPANVPGMTGVNFDGAGNPLNLQAPDGTTKPFPGAVGPGTGDVNGPASATIGSFAVFAAGTGKLIGELTIAQFNELLDDRMRDVIQAGTNITSIVYDDALGTLTINAATQGGGGGGLPPNGTYGNIVVSGSTPGTIWTIGANQVVNSMFATMPANSVKANITGGVAVPTDVLLAAFQAWIALVADNLTASATQAPSKNAVNTAIATLVSATSLVSTNLATHIGDAANPHAVTKAQVGLANTPNLTLAQILTNLVISGTTTLGQDAASAMQAVTLQQLQAAALQVGKRGTARTASVANINLAAPGAALNGVTMVVGDVFLAKDQTAPAENGPYVWNGAAVPATRSPQYDTWVEFPGSQIAANEGTVDADTLWLCTSNDGGTLGTTAISWSKFNIAGALLIVNALSELSGVAGTALTNLGFTSFFAGLRTAANAAALQTAIGLVIGTNVQAFDSTLSGFASLTVAANQMLIGTGADTPAVLAIAANQFAARSSTGNVVAKPITDFAFSILDDAAAVDVRTTIGALEKTNPVVVGPITAPGGEIRGGTAVAGNVVDFAVARNDLAITANGTTLTYGNAGTDGAQTTLFLTLTGGPWTVTVPSTFSEQRQQAYTSLVLPANFKGEIGLLNKGGTIFSGGEPVGLTTRTQNFRFSASSVFPRVMELAAAAKFFVSIKTQGTGLTGTVDLKAQINGVDVTGMAVTGADNTLKTGAATALLTVADTDKTQLVAANNSISAGVLDVTVTYVPAAL